MTAHHAPPVSYPVGRSHWQGGLLLATWLGGLVLTLAWISWGLVHDVAPGWRAAVAMAAVALGSGGAVTAWRRQPVGRLVWDGQVWRWDDGRYESGVSDCELSIVADWQTLLVLRLDVAAGTPLWLWAEHQAFPERWLDLRRAVYSFPRPSPGSRSDGIAASGASPAVAASVSLRPTDSPSYPS